MRSQIIMLGIEAQSQGTVGKTGTRIVSLYREHRSSVNLCHQSLEQLTVGWAKTFAESGDMIWRTDQWFEICLAKSSCSG
jgi:hypothetical protein